ncbi:hypothetical protein SLE2022_335130 [Rubroshorea leprosula]
MEKSEDTLVTQLSLRIIMSQLDSSSVKPYVCLPLHITILETCSSISVMEDDLLERDMISQLPNSILGTILSFLSLRKAVRTSVLSTRWRKIWTTSLSVLNFDADNMLGKIQYYDTDHSFVL